MSKTPEEKSKQGTPEILTLPNTNKPIISYEKDEEEKELPGTSVTSTRTVNVTPPEYKSPGDVNADRFRPENIVTGRKSLLISEQTKSTEEVKVSLPEDTRPGGVLTNAFSSNSNPPRRNRFSMPKNINVLEEGIQNLIPTCKYPKSVAIGGPFIIVFK
ncbi:uncharacterized protein LOC143043797 [Mytilus galloprovincialis]|uniref:uncharacterized protein LOC143043797 n=1 Tax=Mytilus galloprovincialis TaxID=29158 RepID=UPI003F7C9CF7